MDYERYSGRKIIEYSYLHKAILKESLEPICKKYKIKQSDLWVIISLIENPTQNTSTKISELGDMKRGNLSNIVDYLCFRGFLRTQINENDRRSKYLFLTEKANELVKEIKIIMEKHIAMVLDGITQEELDYCENVFDKMQNNLKSYRGK